jgi:hypothetical protein
MRASLVVLGATAFMSQANARVIDSMLHVLATDFRTVPARAVGLGVRASVRSLPAVLRAHR